MATETIHHTVEVLVAAKKEMQGGLLPLLHDIQDAVGYIPYESVGLIAQELNLSRAEVHGVITFYHHFRSEPVARTVVRVCRAEACQSMGSEHLWAHACSAADSHLTVEPVYCLGLCSSSPAMALNDKVHARVDRKKFDRLVAIARSAV